MDEPERLRRQLRRVLHGKSRRAKNLAHYVYQSAAGRIYSWGEQFNDLVEVNTKKGKDYSVIYRIMVHG